MIPQPFIKGAGERVYFGPYEYVGGADLIFDFGNPLCTSAFNSSRIVYNVGSANVTGSLIPYFNPGLFYPTLSTDQGGTMVTRYIESGTLTNYLTWDWKSTENQSQIYIYRLNGGQAPGSPGLPANAGNNSISSISYSSADIRIRDSSGGNTGVFSEILDTSDSNGRNGYNMVGVTANNSNSQILYINQSTIINASNSITRTTSGTQTFNYGIQTNLKHIAFLQYPKILTPKEIRQTYKVFAQRFFT
jgi:hypothetical protein